MKNIFLRTHDAVTGISLPDGHLQFQKFGADGFVIHLQLPPATDQASLNAADKFIQDVSQVMHYMRNHSLQDVEKGLRIISEMESYFTHGKFANKLVPQSRLDDLQRRLDDAIEAKRSLQQDNDIANQSTTKE